MLETAFAAACQRFALEATIRVGDVSVPLSSEGPRAPNHPAPIPDGIALWNSCGRFQLTAGREIVLQPAHPPDWAAMRLQLLGPCMGALLAQRGRLVLHGGAVAASSGVMIFAGNSGAGKSTLTAALSGRGHQVLADDMSVFTDHGEGPARVHGGNPLIKLWPDSASRLGLDPDRMPRICQQSDKRQLAFAESFVDQSRPVRGIYCIHDGPELAVERLTGTEALVELVAQTYGIRVWPKDKLPLHLSHCARLIEHVRVCRLYRPRTLDRLDELVTFVETEILNRAASAVRAA